MTQWLRLTYRTRIKIINMPNGCTCILKQFLSFESLIIDITWNICIKPWSWLGKMRVKSPGFDESAFWQDLRIASVSSATPAPETRKLPILYPVSGQMFCSHCKKALVKGQTAFQRRGSPALFCSTSCLTTFLPASKRPSSVCQNCHKWVIF